jgi:hypothetical protein
MRLKIPSPLSPRILPLLALALALWVAVYEIRHFESACQAAKDLALMAMNPPPTQLVDEVCAGEKQKPGARAEAEVTRELKCPLRLRPSGFRTPI